MVTQEEAEVSESSSSDQSITIGLAVSNSKSSKYAVKWALKNFGARERTRFMLIHVRQRVTLVPTPMGNYVPIDQVRDDIASAYEKEVERQAQDMLLMYKNMCNEKVEADVLAVKGDDVAETISGVISACQIHKLVVGVSSQGNFMRKSKGTTSTRICKCVPSFCMVYVVSKGGLSMVYSPGSEGDNSSEIFQVNESSNSELHSDDKTLVSDITASSISRSNLSGENLDSSSSADHNRPRSLHEYLTGSTLTSTVEMNQSGIPCASGQIAGSSNLPISDKTPTVSSALQKLMLSEDKASTPCASGQISGSSNFPILDKAPTVSSALQDLMLSEDKDDVNCELEKLRLELGHIKGVYKLVQDESTSTSQQIIDLAGRHTEEEARLMEVHSRINSAMRQCAKRGSSGTL